MGPKEILALVLGSNAIMGAVNWFTARMHIKNSENQFEKRLEAQRETDKIERRREVRSEPLLKLRNELARMAGKGEKVGSMGKMLAAEKTSEEFERALADWSTYMASGEFEKALFMQYDLEIVYKADAIKLDYEIARYRFDIYRNLSDEDKGKEYYDQAIEVIKKNRSEVVKVQSEISKLLEEL
jgi:tetratricopeptide (TPR) repeat protein